MHNKARFFLIQFLIMLSLLLAAEYYIRHLGYSGGDLRPVWSNFHQVDTLIEINDFKVGRDGILVADKKYNRFINREGFREREFDSIENSKPRLLLIGDSFTWGLSANPLDSCFADLIREKTTYTVINLGIPAADPAQYEAIATKYIPLLKPCRLLVFFFLGNDIMQEERPIIPFKPFYFYTNAGAMMADDGDLHFNTALEAYNYYMYHKYFLSKPDNAFEWLVSESALLSRIYSLKFRWNEKQRAESAIQNMFVSKKHLYSILRVCRQNCCSLQIVIIPELKEADQPQQYFRERYKALFADPVLSNFCFFPSGNSSTNYTPYPDAHLNNRGHAFYAQQITNLLAH